MSDHPISGVPKASVEAAQQNLEISLEEEILLDESEESLNSFIDEGAFSPSVLARRFTRLKERNSTTPSEEGKEAEKKQAKVASVARIEQAAHHAHGRNRELQVRTLLELRAMIEEGKDHKEILEKVVEVFTDHALADEALDFLLDTTEGDLHAEVGKAKSALNETSGKQIRAGKNIASQTSTFTDKGLGTPQQLRALYQEITGNSTPAYDLFQMLIKNFTYEKMTLLIDFLLASLGEDLKSKGPSIDRAELQRLITESRKLQAILWVFNYFAGRMAAIKDFYQKSGGSCPFSFPQLSEEFMKAIQEKYPSADKILHMKKPLGIGDDIAAQSLVFSHMCDGLRFVAPRLFHSIQHRHDLRNAFVEAMEDLEEQLDDTKEVKEKK